MQTEGVVLDTIANLYSRPSLHADLVTQAVLGSGVTIHNSQGSWYQVGLPDGYQGWIEGRNVRVYAPDQAHYGSQGLVAEVRNLSAFLYHGPSVSARPPAMRATIGCRLEVEEEQDRWLRVALPGGAGHWLHRGDVRLVPAGQPHPRGSSDEVITTARRFLGVPYLWGGCTPLGIDCSGFVQMVYWLHGVQLLRDSSIQFTQPDLAPVPKDDLRPGDLVFFGQERITHVGLFMGEGRFIHATTHLDPVVQISRLEETHWTERYQGGRRP